MPNKRASGIAMLSVPIPQVLKTDLAKIADNKRISLAEFSRNVLRDYARRHVSALKKGGVK